jgi:5-methylcytosine-specific restriction endonuclease McrA
LTIDTVLDLKREYGGLCPYCNLPIAKGHIDHIMPVSKGGTNDGGNLVWVCEKCNHQKRDMTLLQFMLSQMNCKEIFLAAIPRPQTQR